MRSLLPPNATAFERSLEDATARAFDIEPLNGTVWNADACPEEVLPFLAWSVSVDTWDSAWPEHVKRSVIKASLPYHRKKGTIGAVKRAVASLGLVATVVRWFEMVPAGEPYTLTVTVGVGQTLGRGIALDEAGQRSAISAIRAAKAARTWVTFRLGAEHRIGLVIAAAAAPINRLAVRGSESAGMAGGAALGIAAAAHQAPRLKATMRGVNG